MDKSARRSFIKQNLTLAWPLALNAILMQSMLMIDTFLVSPLGEISLAALGVATTIVAFILGIQMALANGTQLIIGRAVGSQSQQALSLAFWSGLVINLFFGVLFWLILTVFERPLIQSLIDDPKLYLEISEYLNVAKYLLVVNSITQVMIAFFNGLARTKIPFKGYLLEMPINALMSYVLIHHFNLGVTGAALGSLVAILIRLAYLTWALKGFSQISLKLEVTKAQFLQDTRAHLFEIFPVAANVAMLSTGATVYQLLFSQLSLYAYVAITLIMPWMRFGTQFITSWSHASAIAISQSLGSKSTKDLGKQVDICIDLAVIMSIISAVFFFILSLVIDKIYPDLDPQTYTALALIAPLYILLPLSRCYNTIHGHMLRALGKTTAVFNINFIGQWLISIPLCALMILYFDVGVFWAFFFIPFEETIRTLPLRMLARKSVKEFNAKHLL